MIKKNGKEKSSREVEKSMNVKFGMSTFRLTVGADFPIVSSAYFYQGVLMMWVFAIERIRKLFSNISRLFGYSGGDQFH